MLNKHNESVQTANLLENCLTKESKAIQVDHDYIKPYLKETIKRQKSNDRYARLSSKVRNNTSMAKESDTNTTCRNHHTENTCDFEKESGQAMQSQYSKRGKTSHSIVFNSDCNLINKLKVSRFRNKPENRYSSVVKDVSPERLRVMPLKKKIKPNSRKPSDFYQIKTKLQKLNEKLSSVAAGDASKSLIRFKNKCITPAYHFQSESSDQDVKVNCNLGREVLKRKDVEVKKKFPRKYYPFIKNTIVPAKAEDQIKQAIKILKS